MQKKSVSVVLSSYNGEKYIESQIDSILSQKDVRVYLHVRDDGSCDRTVSILKKYEKQSTYFSYEQGCNVGFVKSFLIALSHAKKADYYAFADQDDVWEDEKLKKTIELIKEEKICLAFCNAVDTDGQLKSGKIHYSAQRVVPYKGMAFCSSVCSGFLMVFDEDLRNRALMSINEVVIPHDLWVGAIASFLGTIKYTKEPYVYHRRLKNSVSQKKFFRMSFHRMKTLFCGIGKSALCAQMMLNLYKDELTVQNRQLLEDLANYKTSFAAKYRLLRNKKMRYSSRAGRVTIFFKILLNRF